MADYRGPIGTGGMSNYMAMRQRQMGMAGGSQNGMMRMGGGGPNAMMGQNAMSSMMGQTGRGDSMGSMMGQTSGGVPNMMGQNCMSGMMGRQNAMSSMMGQTGRVPSAEMGQNSMGSMMGQTAGGAPNMMGQNCMSGMMGQTGMMCQNGTNGMMLQNNMNCAMGPSAMMGQNSMMHNMRMSQSAGMGGPMQMGMGMPGMGSMGSMGSMAMPTMGMPGRPMGSMAMAMPTMGNPGIMQQMQANTLLADKLFIKKPKGMGSMELKAGPLAPIEHTDEMDPDVKELGEYYDIEERWLGRLNEAMSRRKDTKEADMAKLWEVLESAVEKSGGNPTGLLTVKIGEMQSGRFVGKREADEDVAMLSKRFKLDPHVESRITEMVVLRPESRDRDIPTLGKFLKYSKRPPGSVMILVGKLLNDFWEALPDLGEAEDMMDKYKLDTDARSKLSEIVLKRSNTKGEYPEDLLTKLECHLEAATNPSAMLCKIASKVIEGEALPEPLPRREGKGSKGDQGNDRREGKGERAADRSQDRNDRKNRSRERERSVRRQRERSRRR